MGGRPAGGQRATERWRVCVCGNHLGESLAGGLEAQRHKGRRTLGLVMTQCEECLRWSAPPEAMALLRQLGFGVEVDAHGGLPEAA